MHSIVKLLKATLALLVRTTTTTQASSDVINEDFSLLTPYGQWLLHVDDSYGALKDLGQALSTCGRRAGYDVCLVASPIAWEAKLEHFEPRSKEHQERQRLCQAANDRCRAEHCSRFCSTLPRQKKGVSKLAQGFRCGSGGRMVLVARGQKISSWLEQVQGHRYVSSTTNEET